jgi:hypothetical protein
MKTNLLKSIVPLLLLSVLSATCPRIGPCRNHFEMARQNFTGNQLRTDGYYYGEPIANLSQVGLYYLYRNGILLLDAETLSNVINGNVSSPILSGNIKTVWGVFAINGSSIEMETWIPSINGCEAVKLERGEILNDTTFVITRLERRGDGRLDSEDVRLIYRFRRLAPKPDSTNSFIQ